MKPWMFISSLLGFLLVIESIHTVAHLKMEHDVHGYCRQNAEHMESLKFAEE